MIERVNESDAQYHIRIVDIYTRAIETRTISILPIDVIEIMSKTGRV
jgi:hypothetical protein